MDLFRVVILKDPVRIRGLAFYPDHENKNESASLEEQIKKIRNKTDLFNVKNIEGNLKFTLNNDRGE